jgi:predicted MPP superfamily phosphohydrolase
VRGRVLGAVAGAAAAGLAWALFEAQWVELAEVEVPIEGLADELDGFTIIQLSDFHLGTPSFNGRALERATSWTEREGADIVALTGDFLTRQSGDAELRRALARLRPHYGVYAILGNHDVGRTKDPFSEPTDAAAVRERAVLLEDGAAEFEAHGRAVQIVGADPRHSGDPARLASLANEGADLRILLSHIPDAAFALPARAFHLILSGHLHGGQICVPTPKGRIRFGHLRAPCWHGLHRVDGGMLYVSRGLGTSLVPFRFFARPEATKLVLRSA